MTQVTFTKNIYNETQASTGETIGFYKGTELWGRGSTGWYITEVNGVFRGIQFYTLREAKEYLIRKHNPIQYTEIVIAETDKVLAEYAESVK